MIYLTADSHFDHYNIIRYTNRPFRTTEEMNETMIQRWNSVVKPEDEVLHLGDFALTGSQRLIWMGHRLNGKKTIVRGNHDRRKRLLYEAGFEKVISGNFATRIGNHVVNISHYPYRVQFFDGRTKSDFYPKALEDDGKILLCGHVHEKWQVKNKMINVGVDVWNFTPVSEEQLNEIMDKL